MYLFIFEDGEMKVGNTVTDDDIKMVEYGILDIVKTVIEQNDIFYEQYYDGKWHRINAL